MKKIMILPAVVFLMAACGKPSGNSFELRVNMDGLEQGEKVYLYKPEAASLEPLPVDSAIHSDKEIVFKGTLEQPHPYFLVFERHPGAVEMFLEAGEIRVSGNVAHMVAARVEGSQSQQVYQQAVDGIKEIDRKEQDLYQRYMKAEQENNATEKAVLEAAYEQLMKERETFVITFAGSHPDSPVGPYLINSLVYDIDYNSVQPEFEKLSPEVKAHPYGKQLEDRLAIAKRTSVGSPAPGFDGKTPEGSTISLEGSLGKKLTLIDFWASWCGPCRRENPNVVKLYEEYQPRGLEIIGVSLDDDSEAWKQAIAEDGLNWKHLSDLQGFESSIARAYGIMAIPQTFLLDEKGVILAKGLRGEALREKVEELL